MPTTTTNLGLTLPTPNVDTGWGSTLNTDFTLIDNLFASNGSGTSVGINVGSGKTLLLGGTMLLGTGDATGTVAAPTIRGPARTGTNVSGANITIDASNGTGTAGSGSLIFRTAPAGAAGTTAGTFQSALTVGKSTDAALVDIGAGGTSSTTGAATARLNGSNAGVGTAGGSALYIANNGTSTAAFGNRSNIFGGSTAYDALTTVWGSTAVSFVVGSAPLSDSSEKMRIGPAGQIYFWDTSLGSPALNSGVAGQVLTSNGSSMEPAWKAPTINQVATQTFAASGVSFTNIPATAKTIIITVSGLDPDSTADGMIRVGTSSGFVSTGYTSSSSATTTSGVGVITNTTGFVMNISGSSMSGTIRLTSLGSNTWVCDHVLGSTTTKTCVGGGTVTLAAALDRVQVIPATGTLAATGTVNIMYL